MRIIPTPPTESAYITRRKFGLVGSSYYESRRYDASLAVRLIIGATDKMDTVVADLVSFLPAVKSGSLIGYVALLALVLIGSASVLLAVVYRRILNERRRIASKATQENFEAIAADLRKRALGMKERDDELRKSEERERPQQQQALKEQQRILKQSVSHAITLGLKENQNRLLQIDLKGMLSATQRKRNEAA
jgi:acyl-CoA hydrolase